MRLLVTGASGLLGLNLALEAAKQHTVFGQVNQHNLPGASSPGVFERGFTPLQANLLEPGAVERLLDQAQPDWVIHCAAMAIVDACESDPQRAYQLNSEIPAKLASHVARGGARFLHVSTDAVFDGQAADQGPGYSEEDQPNPLSVYARTKLAGEQLVAAANPQALVARVNLVGWSLRGERSLAEFFFYNLQAGRQVNGFTDVYFCPLLANHLAQIFLRMLELRLSGLYHVVSSESSSKYQYALDLARCFGLDESLVNPISLADSGLAARRSPNLRLSTARLAQALGAPPPDIATGLQGFYTLYQQGYPQRLRQLSTTQGGL